MSNNNGERKIKKAGQIDAEFTTINLKKITIAIPTVKKPILTKYFIHFTKLSPLLFKTIIKQYRL